MVSAKTSNSKNIMLKFFGYNEKRINLSHRNFRSERLKNHFKRIRFQGKR